MLDTVDKVVAVIVDQVLERACAHRNDPLVIWGCVEQGQDQLERVMPTVVHRCAHELIGPHALPSATEAHTAQVGRR